jgi:hypothetical protein
MPLYSLKPVLQRKVVTGLCERGSAFQKFLLKKNYFLMFLYKLISKINFLKILFNWLYFFIPWHVHQ